jgi:transposase
MLYSFPETTREENIMPRHKKVDVTLAEKAEEELKKIQNHNVCMRLQAIASCAKHPVNTVASIFGTSRQTLWRWIKRFKQKGADGLYDLPKGHNPAKLDEEHREQITQWLREAKDNQGNPVHWTLAKLAKVINDEFDIQISTTPLWRLVRKLGFKQKVPRPVHVKADPQAQEAFKKNM